MKIGTWLSLPFHAPYHMDHIIWTTLYGPYHMVIKFEVLSVVAAGMSYSIQVLHQTCVNGEVIFKNVQAVKCKSYSFFDVHCK